jgi:hypothetical protein
LSRGRGFAGRTIDTVKQSFDTRAYHARPCKDVSVQKNVSIEHPLLTTLSLSQGVSRSWLTASLLEQMPEGLLVHGAAKLFTCRRVQKSPAEAMPEASPGRESRTAASGVFLVPFCTGKKEPQVRAA